MYAAGSQNKNNTTDMKGGTGCYSGQHNRINGVSVKTRGADSTEHRERL